MPGMSFEERSREALRRLSATSEEQARFQAVPARKSADVLSALMGLEIRRPSIDPRISPRGPVIPGTLFGEPQLPPSVPTSIPGAAATYARAVGRGFLPPMGKLEGANVGVYDIYARQLDPNNPLIKHINFLGDDLSRKIDRLNLIRETFERQADLGDPSHFQRPLTFRANYAKYGVKTWDQLVDTMSRVVTPRGQLFPDPDFMIRPIPGVQEGQAFGVLQEALAPYGEPALDVSMRAGVPDVLAIRGPGGTSIQMALERGGAAYTIPKAISYKGWNLGAMAKKGVTPLVYQAQELFMGAAVIDARGSIRVLSAQAIALEQQAREVIRLQQAGVPADAAYRQASTVYRDTLAEHRLGGISFENINKLDDLRIYRVGAEGGLISLESEIKAAIGGKVFTPWGATAEHVPEEFARILKGIEGRELPGGRVLTHAMKHAEAIGKGVFGTVSQGEAIAFGQFSDTSRQLYQHFGRGPITRVSVERLSGVKVDIGGEKAAFFATGRAVTPTVVSERVLQVEADFQSRWAEEARNKIALQRQISGVQHAIAAGFGGQRALLEEIAGPGQIVAKPLRRVGDISRVTSQVQVQVGFGMAITEPSGKVRLDPRMVQALIGEGSGGAVLAAPGILETLERGRDLNLGDPKGLRAAVTGQLTSSLKQESLIFPDISVKSTPSGTFRQLGLSQPGASAMAFVMGSDAYTKTQKSSLGQAFATEMSSAVEAIIATTSRGSSITTKGRRALADIAGAVGSVVNYVRDPISGRLVPQFTPAGKAFDLQMQSGLALHDLPAFRQLKTSAAEAGASYTSEYDILRRFERGGGLLSQAEVRAMGMVEFRQTDTGPVIWARQIPTGLSIKAGDPNSFVNKFAPPTKTGFHPEGAVISPTTIRNMKLAAGGNAAMLELATYFEERLKFNPHAAVVAELLKEESLQHLGYNATGGVTPSQLTTIMERLGGFEQLSKKLKGGGVITAEAVQRTIFDPRLRDVTDAWAQGLTIRFDKGIEVPFESQARTVFGIHTTPAFLLAEHLGHPGRIYELQGLIEAEEALVSFAMKPVGGAGKGAQLLALLSQRRKAFLSVMTQGEHPMIEKWLKPRVDVSGAFTPIEAQSPEVIGRLLSQRKELPDLNILARAKQAGVRPLGFAESEIAERRLLDIMGGRDLKDLVNRGLVFTEKVGDSLDYYTYGMAQRHPELPGQIMMSKIWVNQGAQEAHHMRMAAVSLRIPRGDTDADIVSLIFAKDKQMSGTMQRAYAHEAAMARNNPELFLIDIQRRAFERIGPGMDEHLEQQRAYVRKAMEHATVNLTSEATLGKKLSLKFVTPVIHGVQTGLSTHMLTMYEGNKLTTLQGDPGRLTRLGDALGAITQLATIKKAEEPHLKFFQALGKVEQTAALDRLTPQIRAQLYSGILEAAQSQFGDPGDLGAAGGGGRYFFKQSVTQKQITDALERTLAGKEVRGTVLANLQDIAAPWVELVARANAMGESHDTMTPFGKFAKRAAGYTVSEEVTARTMRDMINMVTDISQLEDVNMSTVQKVFQRQLELAGIDPKLAPEEQLAALGMGPGSVIPNVESEMITTTSRVTDPTRASTSRPLFDRISGWFHDPATASWKKVAAAAGALLVGGAIVKNTFFPDLVPETPAAAPPDVTTGIGSAIGTDIWRQLPTVTDSGGRMPMMAPSYGPGLANPQVSPMLGPGMKVPAFEGQYAGTMGSAPLAPTDFSMQTSYNHHQAVEVPHEIPVYMEASERLSPGLSDLVRGREITVSTQRSTDQEAAARLLARQADIYQSPGLIHSRLDNRRAVNERGSLMRAPGMRA